MKRESTLKRKLLVFFCITLLAIGLGTVLQSCYPGDSLSTSDTDLITTFYDPNADFAAQKTYAMPDSVIYINDSGPTNGGNAAINDQILSSINTNMQNLGYTLEADPAQADVHIVALATTTTWVGGSCYPGYWDYWYGYGGWCYPVAYSYDTGTLIITMQDPNNTGDSPALWISGINGILSGSTADTQNRLRRNIDQAFTQSPYLGDGK